LSYSSYKFNNVNVIVPKPKRARVMVDSSYGQLLTMIIHGH
jgi:hypothetical protein